MTFFQSIILGIVQGITEFMPISSSGHTIILPFFLNWQLPEKEMFYFNVLVELGTLVAIIFYFRRDLIAIITGFIKGLIDRQPFATIEAKLGWLLIAATIPAGLAGLLLKDIVEQAFASPLVTGIALLVTAGLMFLSEKINLNLGDTHDVTLPTALFMGVMQSLALIPGISRSGSTMSGGMMRHLQRQSAARFSFLMSVPVMLAAGALSSYQLVNDVPDLASFLPTMILGFLTAMVVGYATIRWLLRFLVNHSLIYFSIYCTFIGGLTILVWLLH